MLRIIAIWAVLLVALAGISYGAAMTPTTNKDIAAGADVIAHCKVTRSETAITTAGVINAASPTLTCDRTGTYTVHYTLTSGAASRTGAKSVSATANVPVTTTLPVSPTLTVSGDTYTVTWTLGS